MSSGSDFQIVPLLVMRMESCIKLRLCTLLQGSTAPSHPSDKPVRAHVISHHTHERYNIFDISKVLWSMWNCKLRDVVAPWKLK